jgi:hypothetical protein
LRLSCLMILASQAISFSSRKTGISNSLILKCSRGIK